LWIKLRVNPFLFVVSSDSQDATVALNQKITALNKDNESLKAQLQVAKNKFQDAELANESRFKESESKKIAFEKDLKKAQEKVSTLEKQLETSSKAESSKATAAVSQGQLAEKDRRITQLEKLLADAKAEADKVIVLEREIASFKYKLEEEQRKVAQLEAEKAAGSSESSEQLPSASKAKPWTPPKPTSPVTKKPLASEIFVSRTF